MSFSRRSLRALVGLWLALLATSSVPHVHAGSEDAAHGALGSEKTWTSRATGDDSSSHVSSHDAHHEHSAQRLDATRPCGVCRSNGERDLVRALPGDALFAATCERLSPILRDDLQAAEHFARLHPPRAPPVWAAS